MGVCPHAHAHALSSHPLPPHPISVNGAGWPTPGRIVKIALGAGAALPTRIGALELDDGELTPTAGVAYGGYAYYGLGNGAKIIKVDMGIGPTLPTRVGEAVLLPTETSMYSGAGMYVLPRLSGVQPQMNLVY